MNVRLTASLCTYTGRPVEAVAEGDPAVAAQAIREAEAALVCDPEPSEALVPGDRIVMTRSFLVPGDEGRDDQRRTTVVVELVKVQRGDPRGAILHVRDIEP